MVTARARCRVSAGLSVLSVVLCVPDEARSEPPAHLVIEDVTVIDATGAPAKPDLTVVVTGGRVAALGKTGTLSPPPGARRRDAAGKFLVPGLWDMHRHRSCPTDRPTARAVSQSGRRAPATGPA